MKWAIFEDKLRKTMYQRVRNG